MIWRYTIHLEMAKVISVWRHLKAWPWMQMRPDILPSEGRQAVEQSWHHRSRQKTPAGWGTPYLEITTIGAFDRKLLATGVKVNRFQS